MPPPKPVTVLVVDDSAFMRHILTREIGADPDIEVLGTAVDGEDVLVKIEELDPNVVTLDVEMPRMDGITALRIIMQRFPRPVLMLSSLTQEGSRTTMQALELGAADFVGKPSGSVSLDFHKVRDELVQKIKAVSGNVNMRVLKLGAHAAERAAKPARPAPVLDRSMAADGRGLVVFGCSTGGPRALSEVVPNLPASLPVPVLIVQHMPSGFTKSLAGRLDSISKIAVREAVDGDLLQPGLTLVAAGDHHLELTGNRRVRVTDGPSMHGVRPAVDVTLKSVLRTHGDSTVVGILTGMGSDGAAGSVAVSEAGGRIVAEDEGTCVVFGMPQAVALTGVVNAVVPLPEIAFEIQNQLSSLRLKQRAAGR